LSVHLTKLAAAVYVAIEKADEGRKPATHIAIAAHGRAASGRCIADLKALLGDRSWTD
jgi:hypothetical protein